MTNKLDVFDESETPETMANAAFNSQQTDLEYDFVDDDIDRPPTQEEIELEIETRERLDIFEEIINRRLKAGDDIEWTVYKNNEFMGTFSEEGSWEMMQNKFCKETGGRFKIEVRGQGGKYIKNGTKKLAAIQSLTQENNDSREDSFSMKDYMSIMDRRDREHKEELRDMETRAENRAKENQNSLQDTIKTFAPLLTDLFKPKQDTSNDMFKFMMDQQNKERSEQIRREEKSQERFEKMMERMDEKQAKMFDSLSSAVLTKDEGPTPLEMFEKIRDAEDRAYTKAKEEQDWIEERVNRKAQEEIDNKSGGGLTDKLLEGLIPALPALMASQGGGVGFPSPEETVKPNPARQQTRKVLNKRPTQRPIKVVDSVPRADITTNTHNDSEVLESLDNEHLTRLDDLDVEPKSSTIESTQGAKRKILELIVPLISHGIGVQAHHEETAEKSWQLLQNEGFVLGDIEKNFTIEDIFQLSKESGLEEMAKAVNRLDEINKWLKDYYESLLTKARGEVREPTNNQV